ncbi:pimeloyl-ACP methyl ester carboxylesterase [Kribbella antiqua]|uniref:Pimeloyl-ACP methyl ester carboxylesterase n=1 Tax=Kribbella antiqua TaxID=2512217 RepID=A0A4V2S1S1_9ACTN|nr:alpha/beta hydrolase [Kribbella antiqua]TCO37640.1 pimeloyl-ACP methyl ester carboxylesterase [Kribbella antiqua]
MNSPLKQTLHGRRRLSTVAMLVVAIILASLTPSLGAVAQDRRAAKPIIVLVHGAWADASSWEPVVERLQEGGYTVRALANPLRSLSGDAAYVRAILETVPGPIVLVGHSYGGAVATNAATGNPNVKALVYVNSFAIDAGETTLGVSGPDSALNAPDPTTVFDFVPATLPPTAATDLYLKKSAVFTSFATGLSADEKAVVTASQRPAALATGIEPSGTPAWRTIPSWYLIGTGDQIIPPEAQRAMAKRAGSTVTEFDAGHLGLITEPGTVTRVIEQAARATVG